MKTKENTTDKYDILPKSSKKFDPNDQNFADFVQNFDSPLKNSNQVEFDEMEFLDLQSKISKNWLQYLLTELCIQHY